MGNFTREAVHRCFSGFRCGDLCSAFFQHAFDEAAGIGLIIYHKHRHAGKAGQVAGGCAERCSPGMDPRTPIGVMHRGKGQVDREGGALALAVARGADGTAAARSSGFDDGGDVLPRGRRPDFGEWPAHVQGDVVELHEPQTIGVHAHQAALDIKDRYAVGALVDDASAEGLAGPERGLGVVRSLMSRKIRTLPSITPSLERIGAALSSIGRSVSSLLIRIV